MALPNYTPERRREVAQLLEIDEQYLYQIIRIVKVAGPVLVRKYFCIKFFQNLRPANNFADGTALFDV